MVTTTALAEPVPAGRSGRVAGRTLPVASLAGGVLGSVNGSLVGPVVAPVVGAVIGLFVGVLIGGVTAAIAALVVRRQPQPSARAARLWFLLPTVCLGGLSVAVSAWLMAAGSWSGEDGVPVVAFGLSGPLALLLAALAAPWCLSPAVRQLHRPQAGRRLLLVAALITVLAGGMLTLGYFRG